MFRLLQVFRPASRLLSLVDAQVSLCPGKYALPVEVGGWSFVLHGAFGSFEQGKSCRPDCLLHSYQYSSTLCSCAQELPCLRASGRVLASQLSELPCQAACTASAAYSTTAEPAQAGSGVAESSAVLGAPPQTEQQPGQGLSQAEPSGSGRAREGLHPGRPAQQHAHGVSQAEPSGSGRAGEGRHWRWSQRQHEHRLGQAEASDSGRASRAAAAGASLGRAWPVRDADDLSSSDEAEPVEPERELRDTDQAVEGLEWKAMEPRGSMARVLASWWADTQRIGLHKSKFTDVVLALHKAARLLDARQAKHFAGLAVREMLARQDELAGMRVEKLVRLLKGPRIGGDKLYLTDLMRGLQPMLIGRMHEFAEAELLELMQALRRQVRAHCAWGAC